MRRAYESWTPGPDARSIIRRAAEICASYASQGYDLTLRQLYYQFVARGWIPNTQQSYKRLGDIINHARMAGLLDWSYIVDRTRNLRHLSHWENPQGVITAAANGYGVDLWRGQPARVEVWVEKEALAGIIQQAADRWDCPWFSCRGYVSQSELWGAGRRIGRYLADGQRVVILHLGDHDPSGIDMTRDIRERMERFAYCDWISDVDRTVANDEGRATYGAIMDSISARLREQPPGGDPIEVRRIALNYEQVEEYDPPPNPAKLTDSRAGGYIAEHGRESWELDALDPATLTELIEDHISGVVDLDLFEAAKASQESDRELLLSASRQWPDLVDVLQDDGE